MRRISAAIAGVVGFAFLAGCASSLHPGVVQSKSPATPNSPFERLWVAGFVSDSIGDVDVNGETVRLLRAELQKRHTFGVVGGEPLRLENEGVFAESAYWRRAAEEHGAPLIVTGSVKHCDSQVPCRRGRGGGYDPT